MADNLALNTLAISQSVAAFFTFMPPLVSVRKAAGSDPEAKSDVQTSAIAATALAVGVGSILAYFSQSATPLFVSLALSALVVAVYLLVLHRVPATQEVEA